MRKRVLSLILCFILAVAMAVPAFAAVPPAPNNEHGWGLSIDGINMFSMQVKGNGSIGEYRGLQLAVPAYELSQRWYYEMCPDGFYRLRSAISKDYALTLLPEKGVTNASVVIWRDSEVNTALYAEGMAGYNTTNGPYRLYLHYFAFEFGATNLNVGAPVQWSSPMPYNRWYCY